MSRNPTRFISGDQVSSVAEWQFGAVDQNALRFAAKLKAQEEAEALERATQARQSGYSEGHTQGYAEGYALGHAQATQEGQRQLTEYIENQGKDLAGTFASLFDNAQARLDEVEQAMSHEVLELACALARQVLRHELSVNPNALLPVVREALGMLTVDSKAAVVRLHPLDLEVLAEVLREEFVGFTLTLVPDASLARGGCLVESAGTVVDGTVDKRWMRALASLGLERPWEPVHDKA